MKKIFAGLAILSSTNLWASTNPIEPVLVPIVGQTENINIQMGKYEVTVKEFTRFVNATDYEITEKCHLYNEHNLPAEPNGTWNNADLVKEPYRPVVCIGGKDAMAYASWLADVTGKPYRLPEFTEWQFAASAGKSSRFAFGDDLDQSEVCDYENIEDAANNAGLKQHHNQRYRSSVNCNDGAIYHTVVGMYRPNDFGLHDMMGNVRELMQTCSEYSKEQPTKCIGYVVGGSGWHWVPRPTNEKDSMPFIGSIEGFRLVLDANAATSMSANSQSFVEGLSKAQLQATVEHQRLKLLPSRPTNVSASAVKNKQVNLNWSAVLDDAITYDVYRGYLDPTGKISRKMEKIAGDIKTNSYLDKLPGTGAVSYQVFANNVIGESQASAEVHTGTHQVFSAGHRIQAEFYHQNRNAYLLDKENQQSVLFTSNKEHYTPGLTPFIPAWVKYKFDSKNAGPAKLLMSVRGAKGAVIEFWQGNSLVAKVELDGSKEFVVKKVNAQLKVGGEPLQIRQANKQFAVLDWFEIQA